jgi:hypothetical protein
MLREADLAMYLAKQNGKGRFEIIRQGMQDDAYKHLALITDLRHALVNNEFATRSPLAPKPWSAGTIPNADWSPQLSSLALPSPPDRSSRSGTGSSTRRAAKRKPGGRPRRPTTPSTSASTCLCANSPNRRSPTTSPERCASPGYRPAP